MPAPVTLLVDNGSLQPAATLALRELATQLGTRIGQRVEPVSLLHSSGIDPLLLNGQPAEILFPALEKRLAAGQNDFAIVPLFFGPSQALTVYVPEIVARLQVRHPALRVRVAPELFAPSDDRLAQILADQVRQQLATISSRASSLPQKGLPLPRVALVDHGSPVAAVTAVRNALAAQLSTLLGTQVAAVAPCSMERRPDPAYDFTAPLLADLLATAPWRASRVIVALQFLLPGRHAGPHGDVARICQQARAAQPQLEVSLTDLVGAHPRLIEILADRWRALGG